MALSFFQPFLSEIRFSVSAFYAIILNENRAFTQKIHLSNKIRKKKEKKK